MVFSSRLNEGNPNRSYLSHWFLDSEFFLTVFVGAFKNKSQHIHQKVDLVCRTACLSRFFRVSDWESGQLSEERSVSDMWRVVAEAEKCWDEDRTKPSGRHRKNFTHFSHSPVRGCQQPPRWKQQMNLCELKGSREDRPEAEAQLPPAAFQHDYYTLPLESPSQLQFHQW